MASAARAPARPPPAIRIPSRRPRAIVSGLNQNFRFEAMALPDQPHFGTVGPSNMDDKHKE
jgi:hypothetical protein